MNRLLEAVELNDYETFATLARSPSLDPRYLTLILDEGETLIHQSIMSHAHQIFDFILDRLDQVDIISVDGITPLMLAIDVSNIYAVHRLLSKGADPNATDISRHRPLNYATQKHDTYLIDLLLVHGADPDPTDQHARQPFNSACMNGNILAAQRILDAIQTASSQPIKEIIARYPDALHHALFNDNPECARWLISLEYKPDAIDSFGETALHTSIATSDIDLIRLMLSMTCKRSIKNRQEETLVHKATPSKHKQLVPLQAAELVPLLAEEGVPIDEADYSSHTPLALAFSFQNAPLVSYLLSMGARRDKMVHWCPQMQSIDAPSGSCLDLVKHASLTRRKELLLATQ